LEPFVLWTYCPAPIFIYFHLGTVCPVNILSCTNLHIFPSVPLLSVCQKTSLWHERCLLHIGSTTEQASFR
jgi:hypothetical protein